MLNRLIIIKHGAIACLLLLCSCAAKQDTCAAPSAKKESPYKALIVQQSETDTAWGYVILHNERQLIKQFSIPALSGNQRFDNRQQAAAVGNLVAFKLNHAQHPGISKNELDSMGIKQQIHAKQKR